MTAAADTVSRAGRRVARAGALCAAVGVVGLVIGATLDLDRFFLAYLVAHFYVLSIALGALVLLMISHAMRAGWPTLFRRLIEAMVASLPVLALLFVPLLFGLTRLYPWLRLDTILDPHVRHLVELKASYLDRRWFILRAALFFASWIGTGELLRRASLAADSHPDHPGRRRMYVASAVLLPVVALTLSFASFDWLMSLTPAWYSTMFPVYCFAGGFLGAIAVLTVLTAAADRAGAIPGINPSHYYAFGRLLLAFVIFWAYVAFFQFLLVWMADKPEEAVYYIPRIHGPWHRATVILAVTQFVVPFFALLGYWIKRRRGPLSIVAGYLVVIHYLDVHWLVLPSVSPGPDAWILLDLAAVLALSGITVAFAAARVSGAPLHPLHDPALREALRYDSR